MALNNWKTHFRWLAAVWLGYLRLLSLDAMDVPPVVAVDQLGEEGARERITALRAEIAWHDELYFKKAAPVISDFAYDQLKRELKALESGRPQAAGGADQVASVGDDRTDEFPLYRHRVKMLSLHKSYTEAELRAFDARLRRQLGREELEYVVEPKFDGLAISVTYEKGRLMRAVTRGNGEQGDDVTDNVRKMTSLPEKIAGANIPDCVEVRGEVLIGWAEFKRLNNARERDGLEPFANPRNLAAGTLKSTDPAEAAARRLEIVFYGYGAWEPSERRPESQMALLQQLRAWGLPTVSAPRLVKGFDALWVAVQTLGRERSGYAFPTDGAVVKLNDAKAQERMGSTTEAPWWAMAYKFTPMQVETRLLAITWQVGRLGVLTPVAELAPVIFGGSQVARATLHNRKEIVRRDLRVGDYVWLEKAGEIVPAITGVNLARRTVDSQPCEVPVECPVCHSIVVSLDDVAELRCPNEACPEQVRRRVEHFAGAVGMKGLGAALVGKLVGAGLVGNVADLYHLNRAQLISLDGVGEKSADALVETIKRSKRVELWRLIYGLGIPRVGVTGAQVLAKRFGDLAVLAKMTNSDSIPDLGTAVTQEVAAFFQRPINQKLVAELFALGVEPI